MKKHLAAVALVATLAQPASAITFSKLTTIYIGAGVSNFQSAPVFTSTAFICSNVSGQAANVRFLILDSAGSVLDSITQSFQHGANRTVSTDEILWLGDTDMDAGSLQFEGTVNIESTQSGVFCTAMIVDPSQSVPSGIALHLVRVNPHPGTVE